MNFEGSDMLEGKKYNGKESLYRPDLTRLSERSRAGVFAQELYLETVFNPDGSHADYSFDEIVKATPAYIKEQEAEFQELLAQRNALAAKNDAPAP